MAKLFRSLRWRLQFWNAVILLIAVGGFSAALRVQLHRLHWTHVDEELLSGARIIEGVMRQVPRPILESLSQDLSFPPGPDIRSPNRGRNDESRGRPDEARVRPDDPPRPARRGDRPSPPIHAPVDSGSQRTDLGISLDEFAAQDVETKPESQWLAELDFPDHLPSRLGHSVVPMYFVAWRADGLVLHQSELPAQPPVPVVAGDERFKQQRYILVQQGPFRNIYIRGPRQSVICVGRSVADDQDHANHSDRMLLLSASSVFVFGLLGGVFLSRKAVQPIAKMTATVDCIGPTELHRRMDLGKVDSELAHLGQVLNSMLERIESSFKQQQQFTADASHELRTPLAVMLSATEHALSRDRSVDEYREQLEVCQRSAARMHGLVESLLMLARLDASTLEAQFDQVDLTKVVSDQIHEAELLGAQKSIEINCSLEAVYVQGVESLLARVVSNLLVNAVQYTPSGGLVEVSLACREIDQESVICLKVIDSGEGIAETDLPRIFERFYRVDTARARSTGGVGLGLAICQSIVKLHRGTIVARSQVGKGSEFEVRLPAANCSSPV